MSSQICNSRLYIAPSAIPNDMKYLGWLLHDLLNAKLQLDGVLQGIQAWIFIHTCLVNAKTGHLYIRFGKCKKYY